MNDKSEKLQKVLARAGVNSRRQCEELISEGPVGKVLEAVLAGFAQFENDIRKLRCQGGMRARVREGIHPWMPPIGYTHSKNLTDRRKLTPDQPDDERQRVSAVPDAAAVHRELFLEPVAREEGG